MKKSGFLVALIMLTIVVVSQNNKEVVFIDDFETYDPGGQLACQNPDDWSTWDIFPCGPEDAHISDMYSHSGINSVNIVEGNDNYYELNEYLTSGLVNVSMMIYIPIGNSAYYNAMSDCDGGTYPEWAFEIYFNTNGDGYLNAGGSNAATFNYNNDIWLYSELIIDLDIDHAYYYVDNNLIYDWQWTLGANGSGCQLQLAAVDFYGIEAASFFFDDFEINNGYVGCLTPPMNLSGPDYVAVGEDINLTWEFPDSGKCFELDSEMKKLSFPKENKYFEHFNIYRDGLVIGTSTELEYTDNIDIAGTYTYCITAVYDIGESECSESISTLVYTSLPAPINLTGTEVMIFGDTIHLTWDSPEVGNWIHWDSGVNDDDGVGLFDGGTFYIASHWNPENIYPYNEYTLTKISFFPFNDPNAIYTLKVWVGANAMTEIISQPVNYYITNIWNEVNLNNPVNLNEINELWFGYAVTHSEGTRPAGIDAGPAIQGLGDMISLDATEWTSMSVEYGLDYNWNIKAYVSMTGKETEVQISKPSQPNSNPGLKDINTSNGNKGLLSYNIYRDDILLANTVETSYSYIPIELGIYTYCVTAVYDEGESECSNDWIITILSNINENQLKNIQVFPNPTSKLVNIKSDVQIKNIKVYNYAGQMILDKKTNNNFYEINTSQFETGIYFFRVETELGIVSERVIVQ
ncbi:MAG: T9SS type A sorting domain-containing protein [Chlorobi bacterium]|nr:T9SS type A sorting domain-containing protein [Chlorobiota bacterium]